MANSVIILAGGSGNRFQSELPKQFAKIAGLTVTEHTVEKFEKNVLIDEIIVVTHPDYYQLMHELMMRRGFKKVKKIVKGGRTRQESSYAGLLACDQTTDKVLIHDAVRMFVSDKIINNVIRALDRFDAVDVAIPCQDTIIEVSDLNTIKSIPKRDTLMRGQTPQGFRFPLIMEAHRKALENVNIEVTDDCGLVVTLGLGEVFVINGDERNIKITFPEDVSLADKLFQMNAPLLEVPRVELDKLKEKVIVIFGHTGGIGREIMRLAREVGAKVYGYSRSDGLDIRESEKVAGALQSVYEREGKIDHVINATGLMVVARLESQNDDDIGSQIDINFRGSVNIVRASIPHLRRARGSLLLFTSSSYSRGRAMYSVYSSSKAAIVNFVQAVSEELYHEGIRINAINPERTDTPLRRKNFGLEPPETLLTPEEVATVALKTLLSSLTGSIVDVRKTVHR